MFPPLLAVEELSIVRLIANFRLLSDAYSECESKIETADTARFAEHAKRPICSRSSSRFCCHRCRQQIKRTEMRAKAPYGDKTAAASIE